MRTVREALCPRSGVVLSAMLFTLVLPAYAQDDVTTKDAASAYGGAFLTGPASNPLSLLNGYAYRTDGSQAPYLFHEFDPATLLDGQLPRWIGFGVEERFRFEG